MVRAKKRRAARKRKLLGTTRLRKMDSLGNWQPQGTEPDIADADKTARTGSDDEAVRNYPPAGGWNDVSDD